MTLWHLISDFLLATFLSLLLTAVAGWWMHSKMRMNVMLNAVLSLFLLVISIVQLSLFFWAGAIQDQLHNIYEVSQNAGIQELTDSLEDYNKVLPMLQGATDAGVAKFEELIDFIFWYRIRRLLWMAGLLLTVVVVAALKGRGSKPTSLDFGTDGSSSTSSTSLNF